MTTPLNVEEKIEAILETASPRTLARQAKLKKESEARMAQLIARSQKGEDSKAKLSELKAQREDLRRHLEKSLAGSVNKDGTPVAELAKFDRKIAAVLAEQKEPVEKLGNDFHVIATEFLGSLPWNACLIDDELPAGIQCADAAEYKSAVNELATMTDELENLWRKPRPRAEVQKRAFAEIDRRAKGPGISGLAAGYSLDTNANFRNANPHGRLDWPTQQVRADIGYVTATDSVPLLCWLFGEQIKKKIAAELAANYDDSNTVAEKDKPALVAALESKIWRQRQVIEEMFLQLSEAGIKARRPHETPGAILLGVRVGTKKAATTESEVAA